jgi:hypothetical protein
MHLGTRTVAAIATLRCGGSACSRRSVPIASFDIVCHSSGAAASCATTADGWRRASGLKFSCTRSDPGSSRSRLLSRDRHSDRPAPMFCRLCRSSGAAEVPIGSAGSTALGEVHRRAVKAAKWLPRTLPAVGPWLVGGTMRTRESARSPPDHRGNRARRAARLPSGPRSSSKPAKESSTCPIEVHRGGEGKAAIGIPAVLHWSL